MMMTTTMLLLSPLLSHCRRKQEIGTDDGGCGDSDDEPEPAKLVQCRCTAAGGGIFVVAAAVVAVELDAVVLPEFVAAAEIGRVVSAVSLDYLVDVAIFATPIEAYCWPMIGRRSVAAAVEAVAAAAAETIVRWSGERSDSPTVDSGRDNFRPTTNPRAKTFRSCRYENFPNLLYDAGQI